MSTPALLSPSQAEPQVAEMFKSGEGCVLSVSEERAFQGGCLPLGTVSLASTEPDDSALTRLVRRGAFEWRLPDLDESVATASKLLDAEDDGGRRQVRTAMDEVASIAARVGLIHPVRSAKRRLPHVQRRTHVPTGLCAGRPPGDVRRPGRGGRSSQGQGVSPLSCVGELADCADGVWKAGERVRHLSAALRNERIEEVLKVHRQSLGVQFRLDTVESRTAALRDLIQVSAAAGVLKGVFLLLDELEKQDGVLGLTAVVRYLSALRSIVDALPERLFLMIEITHDALLRYSARLAGASRPPAEPDHSGASRRPGRGIGTRSLLPPCRSSHGTESA